MQNLEQKKFKNISIVLLFLLALSSFGFNSLNIVNTDQFDSFEWNSDALVPGKIISDEIGFESPYGLGHLIINGEMQPDFSLYNSIITNENDSLENYEIHLLNYKSSYGLQGRIILFLSQIVPLQGKFLIKFIEYGLAFLFSLVITIITTLLSKRYGFIFASVFYVVMVSSSLIIVFATSLYWIAFLWFLPLLIVLLYQNKIGNQYILYLFFCICILLKALCGYEYLSTILIFALGFLFIDILLNKTNRRRNIKALIIFASLSILAFVLALTIHASIRGDSITEGLSLIWNEDVLRRTLGGNKANFGSSFHASIDSSVIEVLAKYLFAWRANIIGGLPGIVWFPVILIYSFYLSIRNVRKKKANSLFEFFGLCIGFLATVSWLILAKSHSYVHLHLNYVLWYFGFIPFAIFIIVKEGKPFCTMLFKFIMVKFSKL